MLYEKKSHIAKRNRILGEKITEFALKSWFKLRVGINVSEGCDNGCCGKVTWQPRGHEGEGGEWEKRRKNPGKGAPDLTSQKAMYLRQPLLVFFPELVASLPVASALCLRAELCLLEQWLRNWVRRPAAQRPAWHTPTHRGAVSAIFKGTLGQYSRTHG